jgi:hypothetical protein
MPERIDRAARAFSQLAGVCGRRGGGLVPHAPSRPPPNAARTATVSPWSTDVC